MADLGLQVLAATDTMAALGLDGVSDTRGRLLELKRRGYQEVVRPLEPFIIVVRTSTTAATRTP